MIAPQDRNILRDLAKRVAGIAALPVQAERRALWKKHRLWRQRLYRRAATAGL